MIELQEDETYDSWSRLQSYFNCGNAYRLRYVEGFKGESQGTFISGRSVHKTIQRGEELEVPNAYASIVASHGLNSPEAAEIRGQMEGLFISTFMEELEEASLPIRWAGRKTRELPNGEDDAWWKRRGPMLIRNYMALRLRDIEQGVKLWGGSTEHRITARLPSGTPLLAFVDQALIVSGDGEPILRDWKTGSTKTADPFQLAENAWLFGAALDIHPTIGEFVYLRDPSPQTQVKRFDLTKMIALVPYQFEMKEKLANAGIFPFNPSSYCSSCAVRERCDYWNASHVEAP